MKGKVSYLGVSRLGLMFGKILDENGVSYYFDGRSLKKGSMNDYQTGMSVNFEIDKHKSENVINVEKEGLPIIPDKKDIVKTEDFFKRIMEWSIEATEENSTLFCVPSELERIKSGSVSYVTGRKGTGKTAIVKNIINSNDSNEKSITLSFKDFPFNLIYECTDRDYVQPNQYISVWQYIICYKLSTLILESEKLDKKTESALKKLLVPADEKVRKLMSRINEISLGISVLGNGANFGLSRDNTNITWVEQTRLLKDIISNISLKNRYYILFDELDEDYKVFRDTNEKDSYISMLTSLFKSVQYIRRYFKSQSKNIIPLVFLRTDIYKQLSDSDKNKWREHLVELEWNTDKIKTIFSHRIHCSYCNDKCVDADLSFDTEFRRIFKDPYVDYGNNKGKRISTFAYITRSTQWRPRDYIQYIKICVQMAIEQHSNYVTSEMVKSADDKFSEYLKQEIMDEIFPVIPQIQETLSILSIIRKQTFNPNIFIEEYNKEVKMGNIDDRGAESVLKLLFEYNIIGNQPSMKGQLVFKYIFNDAKFNLKENVCVHRGLYKALQIF